MLVLVQMEGHNWESSSKGVQPRVEGVEDKVPGAPWNLASVSLPDLTLFFSDYQRLP